MSKNSFSICTRRAMLHFRKFAAISRGRAYDGALSTTRWHGQKRSTVPGGGGYTGVAGTREWGWWISLPPLASRRMVRPTPVVGALQPVRTSVLHRIAPRSDLDPTGACYTHIHTYIHIYRHTHTSRIYPCARERTPSPRRANPSSERRDWSRLWANRGRDDYRYSSAISSGNRTRVPPSSRECQPPGHWRLSRVSAESDTFEWRSDWLVARSRVCRERKREGERDIYIDEHSRGRREAVTARYRKQQR